MWEFLAADFSVSNDSIHATRSARIACDAENIPPTAAMVDICADLYLPGFLLSHLRSLGVYFSLRGLLFGEPFLALANFFLLNLHVCCKDFSLRSIDGIR